MEEAKAAGIKEGKEAGIKEGKAAGMREGKVAGIKEEKRQAICRMIRKGFDKQTVLDLGYTELEYEEARACGAASV